MINLMPFTIWVSLKFVAGMLLDHRKMHRSRTGQTILKPGTIWLFLNICVIGFIQLCCINEIKARAKIEGCWIMQQLRNNINRKKKYPTLQKLKPSSITSKRIKVLFSLGDQKKRWNNNNNASKHSCKVCSLIQLVVSSQFVIHMVPNKCNLLSSMYHS